MFHRPDSRIVLNQGLRLITADRGLVPGAKRDIAAVAGKLQVIDPRLAMAVAARVLLVLGKLLQDEPGHDEVQIADIRRGGA
ncbi:hypothetical protein [Mycobacterium leprae]|nr:hypothetical protein [Mycobacterium leprae]